MFSSGTSGVNYAGFRSGSASFRYTGGIRSPHVTSWVGDSCTSKASTYLTRGSALANSVFPLFGKFLLFGYGRALSFKLVSVAGEFNTISTS